MRASIKCNPLTHFYLSKDEKIITGFFFLHKTEYILIFRQKGNTWNLMKDSHWSRFG